MPKSRHRKNHKKKAAARKQQIQENKSKMEKMQRKFLMDLIQREQEKGLFNNTTPIVSDNDSLILPTEGPIIGSSEIPTEGPSI
jgi:septal ring factor EnvC (AmiA/AmiB activator)